MRTYKRKTCSDEMLQVAREKLEAGFSKRRIAAEFGITEAALRKRLKQGYGVQQLGRFRSVFNDKQEKELAEHCTNLDGRFYGLTFKDLRRLPFEYAESNNISHPFQKESKLAGTDWASKFMKKFNLSLRTP